jgi:hypothetical protein
MQPSIDPPTLVSSGALSVWQYVMGSVVVRKVIAAAFA